MLVRFRCVTGVGVGVCVRAQFGTVEARAYISGNASWRVYLCGMGGGLQRNHVPGRLGVKRSPTGTRVQRVRAFRDLQSSCDLEIAGRAALPPKQTFVNFFSKSARPFVVWRKRKRVVRVWRGGVGGEVCFGELRQERERRYSL